MSESSSKKEVEKGDGSIEKKVPPLRYPPHHHHGRSHSCRSRTQNTRSRVIECIVEHPSMNILWPMLTLPTLTGALLRQGEGVAVVASSIVLCLRGSLVGCRDLSRRRPVRLLQCHPHVPDPTNPSLASIFFIPISKEAAPSGSRYV